jgi:hypothetical protein
MTTEKFSASVQYDDFKGTAAADAADMNNLSKWLEENGHKKANEFLLGVTLFAGENHGSHTDPVSIQLLLTEPRDHDSVKSNIENSSPVTVRHVRVDMNLAEFFGRFKRFSIYLSSHGMLNGKDYTYYD